MVENILDNFTFQGASSAGLMIFQSGNLKYFKSTSEKWHDFYNNAKEKQHCHLIKNSMDISKKLISDPSAKKLFSLIWDFQVPTNDESVYLNEQREKYDHCHGISIIDLPENDILIGLTLTGRRCDLNFAKEVVNHKAEVMRDLQMLKSLTSQYWHK